MSERVQEKKLLIIYSTLAFIFTGFFVGIFSIQVYAADEEEGIQSEEDAVFNLPEDLEYTLAVLTGVETETETESETETETETEEIDEEALAAAEMRRTILLGDSFLFPRQIPEDYDVLPEFRLYHCGELPFSRADQADNQPKIRTMEELEDQIEKMTAGYDGIWSVYVKNLNTSESFIINDIPMKSASIMKLFIMGTVYTAFEEGELDRTDNIMYLMNKMITYSDNEASNELLLILGEGSYADGIARVNTFIQEHGYSDMTVEYNGFNNPAANVGDGYNQVAAKDVGKLLEDVYRRAWMTREESNEAEAMLLAQDTRYKIPAGLPDGVICGNKTGEMDGTENDAAIIYSDQCDYILVVLSSGWGNENLAVSRIVGLSTMVYEFFN